MKHKKFVKQLQAAEFASVNRETPYGRELLHGQRENVPQNNEQHPTDSLDITPGGGGHD